jgi:uncharacterized membrane protein
MQTNPQPGLPLWVSLVPVAIVIILAVVLGTLFLVARREGKTLSSLLFSDTRGKIVMGILAGALVGFLLRPSGPDGVQLPFTFVITRGFDLNQSLVPLARISFNYLFAGGVIGAFAGYIAGVFTKKP